MWSKILKNPLLTFCPTRLTIDLKDKFTCFIIKFLGLGICPELIIVSL